MEGKVGEEPGGVWRETDSYRIYCILKYLFSVKEKK